MKRLWIASGVLVLVFALSILNNYSIKSITEELTGLLTDAQTCYEAGDVDSARELTLKAQKKWDDSDAYIYIVFRHAENDEVGVLLKQVLQSFEREESFEEYTAANAALIARIELLHETEQLNLKNLL